MNKLKVELFIASGDADFISVLFQPRKRAVRAQQPPAGDRLPEAGHHRALPRVTRMGRGPQGFLINSGSVNQSVVARRAPSYAVSVRAQLMAGSNERLVFSSRQETQAAPNGLDSKHCRAFFISYPEICLRRTLLKYLGSFL